MPHCRIQVVVVCGWLVEVLAVAAWVGALCPAVPVPWRLAVVVVVMVGICGVAVSYISVVAAVVVVVVALTVVVWTVWWG